MAAQPGEQTSSDVGEAERDSQQDIPHPQPHLREMFEVVGVRINSL